MTSEAGPGRPEIGKPINVRLGEELQAKVDQRRAPGESRASVVRRLLAAGLDENYTRDVVDRLVLAVEREHDFSGWLANVLATVADEFEDGTAALTAGRPGSWEAQHVERLAEGGQALDVATT